MIFRNPYIPLKGREAIQVPVDQRLFVGRMRAEAWTVIANILIKDVFEKPGYAGSFSFDLIMAYFVYNYDINFSKFLTLICLEDGHLDNTQTQPS